MKYFVKSIYDDNLNPESVPFDISNLSGSRILVGNVEFRLPVIGPERRLAFIKSRWMGVDFNLFFDGGLAWDSNNQPVLQWNTEAGKRTPLFSTGVSVRLNLLGAIVLEPFYAFPLQNGGFSNGSFGLNLSPGW